MATKAKFTSFLDRFLENAHLDAKRILKWYSYVLLVVPLLFWAMLAFNATFTHTSIQTMLTKEASISIAVIVAIVDFCLGYYLMISRKKVLTDRRSYHFFMGCQAIGQLLVGNIICLLLALFGMYQSKQLSTRVNDEKAAKMMNIISLTVMIVFILCFVFLMLLELRKS
ncbi:hypothetical protein [Lactobacillus hamsteri]|uniref:hypothetical protein n=1 Tax=Lactobacillus hamsteri TaxID=96565 RepID=UPI0012DDA544|nr:hypothetical protein [Lactobacillus hamsteri]